MLKQFPKYNRVTRLLQHSAAAALSQASSCTHALALCATIGLAASAAQAQVTGGVMAWGRNSEGQTNIPAAALSGVSAIAGGDYHTAALKDGAVMVWGHNAAYAYGQRTIPTGAQSGVTAIASGANHIITLKGGEIICWGANGYGQCLGTDRNNVPLVGWAVPGVRKGSPVRISGTTLTGVTAIAGGGWHTIALKDGAVLAWGYNASGQCDIPTSANSGVTAIASGRVHTIALKDGAVLAWGENRQGQCTIPAAAQSGVTAIAGGSRHTIALKGGAVLAWGDNGYGQCNIPASANSGVTAIAGGGFHTIALKDGAVLAWGAGTTNTGNWPNFGQSIVPTAALSDVTAIAGGAEHTIALRVVPIAISGGVMAWGWNSDGQTTIPASAFSGVTAIAGGDEHTVALKDGAVQVWGSNSSNKRTIPLGAIGGVTAIASGADHIITLKGGQIICWGANGHGQCLGTDRYGSQLVGWGVPGVGKGSPVRIRGTTLTGVTAIAGGYAHTIALRNTGAVLAWGSNSDGQRTIPASATSGVTAIAGGDYHTIALTNTGAVLAWGRNSLGQCNVPASANSGVTAIAGGYYHTIALKDGAVLAWGAGATLRRFAGDGSRYVNRGQSIVPTAALSGVTAIAGGGYHTLALTNTGAVLAWGAGTVIGGPQQGENSNYGQSIVPADAQSGVIAIAGGGFHTVALRAPAPTITQVTPAVGPFAGGTSITISGTNFVTGATNVSVGGIPATDVNVTSPISLTAITPPGLVAGSVSVDVTTFTGTSSRPNAFTYESPLCPADLNSDGVVNSSDMIILLNAFGNCPPSPTSCPADLNGDSVVNALDVIILSNAYGDC